MSDISMISGHAKVNTWVDASGVSMDVSLYYEVHGGFSVDKEVVLLICGLGGQVLHWSYNSVVKPLVDAGYTVIRVDNRDSGLSTYIPQVPSSPLGLRVKHMFSSVVNTLAWSGNKHVSNDGGLCSCQEETASLDYDLTRPLHTQLCGCKAPLQLRHYENVSSYLVNIQPAYELHDMAVDLLHLMDFLQVSKFHAVGVSMGSMISQWLSCLAPSRILTQSYMQGTTYNTSRALQPTLGFLIRMFVNRKAPKTEGIEEWAQFLLTGNNVAGKQDKNKTFDGGKTGIQVMREYCTRVINKVGGLRHMHAIENALCRDDMVQFTVQRTPTLIIHGSMDELVPTANAHHMFSQAQAVGDQDTLQVRTDEQNNVYSAVCVNGKQVNMVILDGFAHDMPDCWCALMVPKLQEHFRNKGAAVL